MSGALLPFGATVITPAAQEALRPADIVMALRRHATGDWGVLSPPDVRENERGLARGGRLFSAYDSAGGVRFWVITECDRSVTTVLLPMDY